MKTTITMKILKYTAPAWSDADVHYLPEEEWRDVVTDFEYALNEMDVGDKLNFEVELLKMTHEEWRSLQEDFINE